MIKEIAHSTIAMIAVINPVVCGVMLLQLGKDQSKRENVISGIKSMLLVLGILLFAAFVGKGVLSAFGISLDAFKVVGGVILTGIGFQMLIGSGTNSSNNNEPSDFTSLVFFAASPGTITMAITLAAIHGASGLPVQAILGSVLAVIITMAVMLGMVFFSKTSEVKKPSMFSKFMGLIIVSMGIQFILEGIKLFFNM